MLLQVRRYPAYNSLWDEIADLEREINSMFEAYPGTQETASRVFAPAINVAESANETVLVAELPGVHKDDVKISVEKDVLTISGERKQHPIPEKAQWLRNEIRSGEFARSIRLPKGVNHAAISAELTNGVLRIVLPKAEEVKPREIRVK